MINGAEIEELLFNYLKLILKIERSLNEYFGFTGIPYANQKITSKTGRLIVDGSVLTFNFHAIGCSCQFDSIVLDYDIYLDRNNYVVTSPWQLMRFVNSYQDEPGKIDQTQALQFLTVLSEKGIVSKIFESYLIYSIDFEWYASYMKRQVE